MKLVTKYKNTLNNITYCEYILDSGVPLLYLINPTTIDFDIAFMHKAGSIYEELEEVPKGTAHMLEHMLFRPNGKFNSIDEIYKFESGNKEHPAIYLNGATGFKYLRITGHTNYHGIDRLLERLESILNFDKEKLSKDFSVEKEIVLAEKSRSIPTNKDKYFEYLKYLEKDIYPEFTYPVLGEEEDIKKITMDDVEKYFRSRFVRKNLYIAIQADKLDKKVIKKLEEISCKSPDKSFKEIEIREMKNKLDYGSFVDERLSGTTIFFSYLEKDTDGFDYKTDALDNMLKRLIRKVGDESLRDKQGIVYSLDIGSSLQSTIGYILVEIALTVENAKIEKVLSSFDSLLFKELEAYLKSPDGDIWFEHVLSTLLFPHTTQFSSEQAEDTIPMYIENHELFNSNKYRKALAQIKKADLLKKISELQNTPPRIWIEGNALQKDVEKTVKSSNIWSRFK